MISKVKVKDFAAVAHLEESALMQAHSKGLKLSCTKPNVLVGRNGTGKSALLNTLALRTLSFYTGSSCFDDHYVWCSDRDGYWGKKDKWGYEFEYLPGLSVETDNGPALYYRPHHVPGNEADVAHAMVCGYFKEGRQYGVMVDKKSSGEQCQALLQRIIAILDGEPAPKEYGKVNWSGYQEINCDGQPRYGLRDTDYKAAKLKAMFGNVAGSVPMILMDEPEQSLDAVAELALWQKIAKMDCSKAQMVVATHSLYPFFTPNKFNIIETQPGYVSEVMALIN